MASNQITLERSKEINDINFIYTCTKCHLPKPNSEYSQDKKGGKGRQFVTQCKECRRKYNRFEVSKEKKNFKSILNRRKNRLSTIFSATKGNAKKRNIEHNIDIQYIKNIYNIQKGLCYYTNKEMLISLNEEESNDNSISIDRIDSSKGYIKGNIVLCRWIINRMKNDITLKNFLQLVSEINIKFNV